MKQLILIVVGFALVSGSLAKSSAAGSPDAVTNSIAAILQDLNASTQRQSLENREATMGLYHAGRFTDVQAAYREFNQDNVNPNALLILGKSLIAMGKSEEGINVLKEVARRLPQNGRPFCELGELYLRLGNREEGIKYLRQAVQVDPLLAQAYYDIALNSTDALEARHACEQVILLAERGSDLAAKAIELLEKQLKAK